ncbi:MAG TPA: hypothetical protein VGX28_00615 [Frankiaceae bacterium]|nr:hypothetical protein [Frankiaceae bacterium]
MSDERGSIIVGWLTKVAVVLTLVGIVGFDLVSVATTKVSASDDAQLAARAGAETYADTHGDVQEAYAAALRHAERHGGSIDPADFVVDPDGTVRVTVVKTATTLVFYRAGATKRWAHVVAKASAKPQ